MNIEAMEKRLKEAFPGADVAAIDMTGTQDHWEVRIHHPDLKSLPRIKQHQRVMAVFADELKTGAVHALSIRVL